jgi:hypothetical protein
MRENYKHSSTCSSFFKKFKNSIFKFQKNLKLNVDIYNVEIYKHAKFQLKIRYDVGCAKITKSDICNSEQCKVLQLQNLSDFINFVEP